MPNFVIDTSAWIEYFKDSEKGRKAAAILEDQTNQIFTSAASVAEIISKTLKEGKETDAALNHLNNSSVIVGITKDISILSGNIHFESKKKNKDFGMIDAFVVATARKLNAKILTTDYDFKSFKEAVIV